ncbi:alpha/beta fold hydrolase [Streptomyces longisporoflavus]|uniref:Alpha/beta fold hydrolase n=1 Tax=Streptomyces longisporoflavus TaxID=28044 RepID=A0ABW7R526_9ACTN|nr:alpha/beta hydrolase [Streptomyces longisporoflavus]GGV71600.1 alpha/beta hydrolase [Streptomyces longisporoflavus]
MPYVEANGTRLHVEARGQGPALVLLHGTGTSGRVWDAQLADLAEDYRMYAVDARGCGRSDRPAEGNDIAGNTADVLAVIDALGLDRPVLVGSSVGAVFAIEAALAAPDRIGGIVSIDGPGYWPAVSLGDKLVEVAAATDRAAQFADWVPTWYSPAASPELIASTLRQILESSEHVDELFADGASYDPRERIRELAVPVLFLHGALDASIPYEVSQTLAGLAPRGTFRLIEGAGHMPHQERPEAVNAALRQAAPRLAA